MTLLADRIGVLLGEHQGMTGPALVNVVDRTGLHGAFDFHLDVEKPVVTRTGSEGMASIANVSYVSGVLKKQLGLKLIPTKINIDYVVVDHVDKVPTEN